MANGSFRTSDGDDPWIPEPETYTGIPASLCGPFDLPWLLELFARMFVSLPGTLWHIQRCFVPTGPYLKILLQPLIKLLKNNFSLNPSNTYLYVISKEECPLMASKWYGHSSTLLHHKLREF